MQQNSRCEIIEQLEYLVGNQNIMEIMETLSPREPFNSNIVDFCNEVSRVLLSDSRIREYPEIATLGFWIRKASIVNIKKRLYTEDNNYHMGRGVAFHIAPSNVPVNFAYSLFSGLLTGNANIVRVPSKDFPQVGIICDAIKKSVKDHKTIEPYICLIRYGRNKEINDYLTEISDVRIIWGGDNTICEIRKSPLKVRGTEITFSDRFSLAVIDCDSYINSKNKVELARAFYNDTYFSDQNACTSPMLITWLGNNKEQARKEFWKNLHDIVMTDYVFQDIQVVDKLTMECRYLMHDENARVVWEGDNYISRVQVQKLTQDVLDYKGNSGLFFEYECDDILDLIDICDDTRVQTIGYLGEKEMFTQLLLHGVHGVDRIVPIGHTMDFDFLWDGYNLFERMTRTISVL